MSSSTSSKLYNFLRKDKWNNRYFKWFIIIFQSSWKPLDYYNIYYNHKPVTFFCQCYKSIHFKCKSIWLRILCIFVLQKNAWWQLLMVLSVLLFSVGKFIYRFCFFATLTRIEMLSVQLWLMTLMELVFSHKNL